MHLEPDEETALVSFAYNLGLGSAGSKLAPFVAEYQRTGSGLRLMLEWLDWCKATTGGRKRVVEGAESTPRRSGAVLRRVARVIASAWWWLIVAPVALCLGAAGVWLWWFLKGDWGFG